MRSHPIIAALLVVRTIAPTRFREAGVYDQKGRMIAKQIVDMNGQIVEDWSLARSRQQEHQACLQELRRGGCCFPEQHPPPGTKRCVDWAPP